MKPATDSHLTPNHRPLGQTTCTFLPGRTEQTSKPLRIYLLRLLQLTFHDKILVSGHTKLPATSSVIVVQSSPTQTQTSFVHYYSPSVSVAAAFALLSSPTHAPGETCAPPPALAATPAERGTTLNSIVWTLYVYY